MSDRVRPLRAATDELFFYTADELREFDARASRDAEAVKQKTLPDLAAPIWDYNLFLMYGQSIGVGQECWPAKSLESRPDVLMFGDCVRSAHRGGATFRPLGGPALKPMRAIVQDRLLGTPMRPSDIAELEPGADNFGESPLEGALKMARVAYLRSNPTLSSQDHLFVGTNTAMSGRTVEQLSKRQKPDHFAKNNDVTTKIRTIARSEGRSFGMACIFYIQGESNYANVGGATSDTAAYKDLVKRLYDDLQSELARETCGQQTTVPIITYQAGGPYTNATVSVGQAQFELSLENDFWFLAAPFYPVMSKGPHLDANGSRWLGIQLGKVWHQVVVEKRNWRPLSPSRATWRGRHIVIEFHVPCAPLQFKESYNLQTPTMLANRGFIVVDDHGTVPCTIEIVGSSTILLSADRGFDGPISIYYASQRTGGLGNLCDSDATVATDNYHYEAGSGDYPSADLTALNGRPYPLWNWCIAFALSPVHDDRPLERPEQGPSSATVHDETPAPLSPVEHDPEVSGR